METREALPDTGENKHVLVGLNPHEARVASPRRSWLAPETSSGLSSQRAEQQLQPTQGSQNRVTPGLKEEDVFLPGPKTFVSYVAGGFLQTRVHIYTWLAGQDL